MCQGRDGRLFWAVASQSRLQPRRTETHLFASVDGSHVLVVYYFNREGGTRHIAGTLLAVGQ